MLLVLLAGSLAGCATQEYRRAETECAIDAYQQYPVNPQPALITDQRPVQVPRMVCTNNAGQTVCNHIWVTRFEPYQYWGTVDVNTEPRNAVIATCAKNLCEQRFGNPDCKDVK
jgi:hypothetical protein